MVECCASARFLNFAGTFEFHDWDEVFGAELTSLWLNMYQCEFCERVYYSALEEEILQAIQDVCYNGE